LKHQLTDKFYVQYALYVFYLSHYYCFCIPIHSRILSSSQSSQILTNIM